MSLINPWFATGLIREPNLNKNLFDVTGAKGCPLEPNTPLKNRTATPTCSLAPWKIMHIHRNKLCLVFFFVICLPPSSNIYSFCILSEEGGKFLIPLYSKQHYFDLPMTLMTSIASKCGHVLLYQVMGSVHIQEKTELLYALINGRQLSTLPKLTQVLSS
jgi:hypothetical protein